MLENFVDLNEVINKLDMQTKYNLLSIEFLNENKVLIPH